MDKSSDSLSSRAVSPQPRLGPGGVAVLALALLVLGTVVGYAFGVGVYKQTVKTQEVAAASGLIAPLVKGMHASPDGKLLAFTGVYDQSRRAGRFVFDMQTHQVDFQETPYGWQDYIMQWSSDSRSILFEREKIPRPVADAKAGFYQQVLKNPREKSPRLLSRNMVPDDEKVIAGFWTPDDRLALKTRREPKSLYVIQDGKAQLLDHTEGTYLQNRAVRENGRVVYYVVRNLPNSASMGLFRIQDGKAKALTGGMNGAEWIYIAENARWMIACYVAENDNDWDWELYSVRAEGARLVKKTRIPGDVIAVYWSPDLRSVLGTGGESLWVIDVPTLKAHRIGQRKDWNADDATWLDAGKTIAVAADGKLWKMNVDSGSADELWRFPDRYWN